MARTSQSDDPHLNEINNLLVINGGEEGFHRCLFYRVYLDGGLPLPSTAPIAVARPLGAKVVDTKDRPWEARMDENLMNAIRT